MQAAKFCYLGLKDVALGTEDVLTYVQLSAKKDYDLF